MWGEVDSYVATKQVLNICMIIKVIPTEMKAEKVRAILF